MIGIKTGVHWVAGVIIHPTNPIKAKTVNVKFGEPEFDHILEVAGRFGGKVIPIYPTPTVNRARRMMKEGIPIFEPFALGAIHRRIDLIVGMVTPGVVEGNVEDHRNPALVTAINQPLKIGRSTIAGRRGKVEDRIITPTRIAGESLNWH